RRKTGRPRPISISRSYTEVFRFLAGQLHGNCAPAAIGIWLRIVAQGIEVREILPDGLESLLLFLPVLRKVGLAAGTRAHALEYRRIHGIFVRFPGADHIDRDAF